MKSGADQLTLVPDNQLVILDSNTPKSPEDFKARLFALLLEKYSEYQEKIFYIGSRFDKVTYHKESYDINRSGSFFNHDVIVKLKQMNFKVIICCLEYKFFRRSITQLTTAATMLKEQLFHADGIHFLNQLDLIDFNLTIHSFVKSPYLEALPGIVKSHEYHSNMQYFDFSSDIESIGIDQLKKLKDKAKHIPGIYTVLPLHLSKDNAREINLLISRPPYLLCFGLIRKHKGVEEAIDLAKTLYIFGDNRRLFIVGKIIGASLLFLRNILKEIYQFTLRDYNDIAINILKEKYKVISGLDIITHKKMIDFSKFNENTLSAGKDNLNKFCTDVIQQCDLKFKKHLNIVILLNQSEIDIHRVALNCRYAIKLDHKGMADNASTIVSCLGLCLPTFTACGLLTDECFSDPALHQIEMTSNNCYRFCNIMIMPHEKYGNLSAEICQSAYTF